MALKSVTVSIGADTHDFEKGIKKVNRDINTTTKDIKQISSLMSKQGYNPTAFLHAQNQAKKAIELTTEKVKLLKDRLKSLENNGEVDTDHYRKMQRELGLTELKAQQLNNEIKKLNQIKVSKFTDKLSTMGDSLTKAGKSMLPLSMAMAGLLASFGKIGQSTIKYADDLQTMADRMGISAVAMQKWQYIAMQTDVTNQELATGFRYLSAGIAKLGSGQQDLTTKALEKLGISGEQALKGLEGNIDTIITKLMETVNPVERLALANDLFGKRTGQALMPMLNQGVKGLQELKKEFEAVGYLSNEQAGKLGQFDNVMNRLKQSFINIKNAIGYSLLPVFESMANYLTTKVIPSIQRVVSIFTGFNTNTKKVIAKLLAFTAALAPILLAGGAVFKAVSKIVTVMGLLNGKLTLLAANPIVLIIGALIAMFTILYTKSEQFRNAVNELASTLIVGLKPILDIVMAVFNEVKEVVSQLVALLGETLAPIFKIITSAVSILLKTAMKPLIVVFGVFKDLFGGLLKALVAVFSFISKFLAPVFKILGKIISTVVQGVMWLVEKVLQVIEGVINFVIDTINWVLKAADKVSRFFGGKGVQLIEKVDITSDIANAMSEDDASKTKTKDLQKVDDTKVGALTQASSSINSTVLNTTNTNNNYNYTTDNSSKTQNIEVKVENYAREVDVDDLVRQINIKLAKVA